MKFLSMLLKDPAAMRKAVGALIASALLLVGAHQLPDAVGIWLNCLQPLLIAYGVWVVPNKDEKAPSGPSAGL